MRRVLLATPTYSGSVRVEYVGALLATLVDLCQRGILADIQFLPGNCYIALARNELVSRFLKSEADDLVFIDDDVVFPADAVHKLLSHDVELVAGAYPLKRDDGGFPVRVKHKHPVDGLIECEGVATGFMRIKRTLLERMIYAMPDRKFTDPVNGNVHHELFACERVKGTWWGEDYRFCQLAASVGATAWLDPTIEIGHVGTKTFNRDLNTWLGAQ